MAIKTLAQSMVQNGVPASTIAEMVDAENFSEIKLKISSAEKQLQYQISRLEDNIKQFEKGLIILKAKGKTNNPKLNR